MYKKIFMVLLIILWVIPAFAQAIEMNPDSIPFAPPVTYSAGVGLVSIFCANLDRDNDIDLVVVDHAGSELYVMWNNGEGTLLGSLDVWTGWGPTSVFCPDLYEDGVLDLVVTCEGGIV